MSKPIDDIRDYVKNVKASFCPFIGIHTEYKYIWFRPESKFECHLYSCGMDFTEPCAFEDFKTCPLFPLQPDHSNNNQDTGHKSEENNQADAGESPV